MKVILNSGFVLRDVFDHTVLDFSWQPAGGSGQLNAETGKRRTGETVTRGHSTQSAKSIA
jgi:hypothetical protein